MIGPSLDVDVLVGANLRRLREDACLDRPALAARLGLAPERLRRAEAGEARLPAPDLRAAAEQLRLPVSALFVDPLPPRLPS